MIVKSPTPDKGPQVVQLINGGTALIDIHAATYQDQVFIRLSPTLIIGSVNTILAKNKRCDNIYLWQKVGGRKNAPYQYLGDISLFRSRKMQGATVFGFTLSRDLLPPSLKVEALKRQKTLSETLCVCTNLETVFGSVNPKDGLICCPRKP